MERVLRQGDYVPDGTGGLQGCTGGEDVLARALFRLTARRGGVAFLPNLGSRLYQLGREKPSVRQALAAQYVAEALRKEPDLQVESVEWEPRGEGALLTVRMTWQGETLTGQLEL